MQVNQIISMARTACASETVTAFVCIIKMDAEGRVIATQAIWRNTPQSNCISGMGRGRHGQEYCVTHGLTRHSGMNVSRGSSGPHCAVSFDFGVDDTYTEIPHRSTPHKERKRPLETSDHHKSATQVPSAQSDSQGDTSLGNSSNEAVIGNGPAKASPSCTQEAIRASAANL